MMNKKGDVSDGIFLLISLLTVAIIMGVYAFIIPSIATSLNQTGIFNDSGTQRGIAQLNLIGGPLLNEGFGLLLGGFIIAQLITAFLIRVHPAFIFLYFVFLVVGTFLAIYAGNVYDTYSQIPTLAATIQNSQPIQNFFFHNIVPAYVAIDLLTILIIFAKVGEPARL